MLAIQNQLSVLSKILATKIQNQQILEHQQAVSATLSKVNNNPPSRFRRTSSSVDSVGQSSTKEKAAARGSTSSEKFLEVSGSVSNGNENEEAVASNGNNGESTGCVVS